MAGNLSGIAELIRKAGAAQGAGDTVLAHINPREAAMLKAAGGSGQRNPVTGLPSYDDRGTSTLFASAQQIADAGFDPDRSGPFLLPQNNLVTAGTRRIGGQTVNIANRLQGQGGSGRALEGTSILPSKPAGSSGSAPAAAVAAPAAAPVPAAAPAAPKATPSPTPIGQSIIGAVNRSSGDTGIGTISAANKARAARRGTSAEDLVYSVDRSRARSQRGGIVRGATRADPYATGKPAPVI